MSPISRCAAVTRYAPVTHTSGRHPDANFRVSLSMATARWSELLVTVDFGVACPISQASEPIGGTVVGLTDGALTLRLDRTPVSTVSVKVSTCLGGTSLVPTISCRAPQPPSPPPVPSPPLPPSQPPLAACVNRCAIVRTDEALPPRTLGDESALRFRMQLIVSKWIEGAFIRIDWGRTCQVSALSRTSTLSHCDLAAPPS